MNIDFISREMIGKLRKQAATEMKRARIISRFVIRRAKEVNERLDRLEVCIGCHMRKLQSVGRSLQLISKLLGLLNIHTDKIDSTLEEYREHCFEMWESIRKGENKIRAIEGDMNDNSEDCASMWNHIRALEIQAKGLKYFNSHTILNGTEIRKLQDKVNALEKLHTTKIAQFIFSPPPDHEEQKPGDVEEF